MNNNAKCEFKRLERAMRRLKKNIAKLERGIVNRLDKSYDVVINAICSDLVTDKTFKDGQKLHRIDPVTGECIDYLIYFPDSDKIHKIHYYLEAYLITNRDVLEEDKIGELEGLIRYFR